MLMLGSLGTALFDITLCQDAQGGGEGTCADLGEFRARRLTNAMHMHMYYI